MDRLIIHLWGMMYPRCLLGMVYVSTHREKNSCFFFPVLTSKIFVSFVFGTPLFEIDLVSAEAETASEAKSLGSLAAFQYIPRNTDASVCPCHNLSLSSLQPIYKKA